MIYGKNAQAYPCFDTPAELHLAECRGSISVTMGELRLFREKAEKNPEIWTQDWQVEYFDAMRVHLAALRTKRERLKKEAYKFT